MSAYISWTLVLFIFVSFCCCQSGCALKGTFYCTGGPILGINFGDDEDDDYFEYYSETYVGNEQCGVYQLGLYTQSGSLVTASFDSSDCYKQGNNECSCLSALNFVMKDNCATAIGPNQEVCTIATCK